MSKKVWLAIIIALMLMISVPASAELLMAEPFGSIEADGLHVNLLYLEEDGTDVGIPGECEGNPVVSLDAGAMDSIVKAERIYIPASVQHIDEDVFANHKSATFVVEYGSYAHQYVKTNKLKHGFIGDSSVADRYQAKLSAFLGDWIVADAAVLQGESEDEEIGIPFPIKIEIGENGLIQMIGTISNPEETFEYPWFITDDAVFLLVDYLIIEMKPSDNRLSLVSSLLMADCIRPNEYARLALTPKPEAPATVLVNISYRPLTEPNTVHSSLNLPLRCSNSYLIVADFKSIPAGCEVVGSSEVVVTVDDSGNASPANVVFFYQEIATPSPTATPTPKWIIPTDHDTQMQTASDGREMNPSEVDRMLDGNSDTYYCWLLWQDIYLDEEPEFTFYFNDRNLTSMEIMNGRVTSEYQYNKNARVKDIKIKIYHKNGSSILYETLEGEYTTAYQSIDFEKVYEDVYKVELWTQYRYAGTGDTKFYCYITDIKFMGY